MGKSHAARCFQRLGVPVFDADAAVHELYDNGEAAAVLKGDFPEAISGDKVDRKILSQLIVKDRKKLHVLESVIHPLVHKKEQLFMQQSREKGYDIAILEVPLLFETGSDKKCDKIAVVSCPLFIQKRRALRREGMTNEKFQSILKRQMPDKVKRQRADFIIQTGLHKNYAFSQIKKIVQKLRDLHGGT